MIVFNFFSDSQVKEQWRLLDFINIEQVEVVKKESAMQSLEDLDFEVVKEGGEEGEERRAEVEYEREWRYNLNMSNNNS